MAKTNKNGISILIADSAHEDLNGGNGKDILIGDSQINALNGENGKDLIYGGKGADLLTGGHGSDTFVWLAGDLAPVVNLTTPAGWGPQNQRGGGSEVVDTRYGDSKGAVGGGSLDMHTGGSADKIDLINNDATVFSAGSAATGGANTGNVLATLGNLNELSYDWYRDASSTTGSQFAPALRLEYWDAGVDGVFGNADDKQGILVFEHIYQAQANGDAHADVAPTNQWVHENLSNAVFWNKQYGQPIIEEYNHTLSQYQSGTLTTGGVTLDASTRIVGIEVGLGSGWSGTFDGAVDNVHIAFGAADAKTWDFGQASTPVDTITDFGDGKDSLDLSALLHGYTPTSNRADFVKTTVDAGGNTHVYVDTDGAAGGSGFQELVVLQHATINLAHDIIY